VANQENVSEILVHAKRGERIPMAFHGSSHGDHVGDRTRCPNLECRSVVLISQQGKCPACGNQIVPKQPKAVSVQVESLGIEESLG